RKALLGEIGVLQSALLPDVPDEIGGLRPSVAYRPAVGLAAGGDFYDAFPLEGGRVGIVIGDISGHGRDALMHTSLLRHTLRAYLDAGLEPRAALQVGGRVLEREGDDLATVIVATYDPKCQILRYASAGHPPPVFLGPADHVPVTRASSPPIGAGVPTGLRQTTVSVPHDTAICLFTDGLIEARREGRMIGRLGLVRIISELGREMSAQSLLDRVASEADGVFDDMAACLFRVEGRADVDVVRIEELEVRREDLGRAVVSGFLAGCVVEGDEAGRVAPLVRETVERFGRAVVRVTIAGETASCEVLPANVESLAAASSRRDVA
ncbi:MAG: PP2C family protein-serine/threonine phosphatase, partial [Gaiellaceae bacterium]